MIVLSGALVLVALVLLVFGALDRNLPYVYASIGVSVLSLLLLLVGILQRRGELTGEDRDGAPTPVTDTSAERMPALVAAGQEPAKTGHEDGGERTTELPAPVPAAVPAAAPPAAPVAVPVPDEEPVRAASRKVVPEEAEPDGGADEMLGEPADEAFEDLGEPGEEDIADEGSGVTVLVVSGRPRYHLEGCRVLRGKPAQPLDRDEARTHGFSPCGVCKPDADVTAGQDDAAAAATTDDGLSFTASLFGEQLFADAPAGTDRVATSALPDRPVQPVLPRIEPEPEAAARPPERTPPEAAGPDVEPLAELRGDDPADAAVVEAAAPAAPDLVADVEEPAGAAPEPAADADEVAPPEPVVEQEAAPVRRARAAGRKAPATRPGKAVADKEAPVGDAPAAVAEAAGKQAPAKKAAAKKAPAKKAPAKKAAPRKAPTAAAPAAAPAPAPQVKRPLVRAVRADALHLASPATRGTTTRVAARGGAPAAGASVVVVPDRDRFHRPQCRFVRDVAGATTLPKASATRQGYAPCGVCKP